MDEDETGVGRSGEEPSPDTDAIGEPPLDNQGSADEPGTEVERPGSAAAALRLLAAAVTLPWMILYGITGAWAVTRGARAAAQDLPSLDAGYTRLVTPFELIYVGALLLVGFAVPLACALLLVTSRRSAALWLPVLLVAAGLTAGSVWAAASGGLHPLLWLLFFFGLAFTTLTALVRMAQVTRAGRRGRIVSP